ncbi:Rieske (2Fe-2S) protein [Mucilaginibacter psychrotolerans]|uniref:Rieske (2Fe-2S) protein n=1 Tax=Mucilaginibacter psychrotolerans TaxID=1524096 RepID=A0A4Y8SJJ5_9SPHI|nr:Rieske 2Fe-2S domain-containing protein [Mucilaginibacter psychrotolerans]TFF39233.1 Rieske (2Fe-2S) protein [Mucilaginibacter psychrotolerans]
MKWYPVDGVTPNGEPFIKKVKVAGKSICIVGYEGGLFALGATCPHAREDLSSGWCADGKLVCPYHRFSYDLQTGKGSPGQNDYVECYPVKVKGKEVYVGIESFFDKLKQALK